MILERIGGGIAPTTRVIADARTSAWRSSWSCSLPSTRFDRVQQRTALAIPLAVVKKFGNDQGGNLAALVAYYAFFSLFPLLLVFVTILGYVLNGDQSAIDSVENSVLERSFPVIGELIEVTSLKGSPLALVIGLLTSLWAGLGVTTARRRTRSTRSGRCRSRTGRGSSARGSAASRCSTALGVLFMLATAASGLVSAGLGGPAATVGGIAASLLANVTLFFAAFRLMTTREVATRSLRPGVVLAAVVLDRAAGGRRHLRQSRRPRPVDGPMRRSRS